MLSIHVTTDVERWAADEVEGGLTDLCGNIYKAVEANSALIMVGDIPLLEVAAIHYQASMQFSR